MYNVIEAACGCNTGRIRRNNEDNFYFNGFISDEVHNGLDHPLYETFNLTKPACFAVFDGMGGEEWGERASFRAAETLKTQLSVLLSPSAPPRHFWEQICQAMNAHICLEAKMLNCGRMGTTMVGLLFCDNEVYMCNVGDSRAFRLRDNELLQLSKDHTVMAPSAFPGTPKRKPYLSQFLGIFPDELILQSYISKGKLQKGDQYLICSDGLTDMLTNIEICAILMEHSRADACVEALIKSALEKGGKDNITATLCRII